VAERLVQQVELQAHALARPLNAALLVIEEDEGLPDDVRERLLARTRATIRTELLALESEQHVTVTGQLTDTPWSETENG
jgi:hypothetical protein